MATGAPTRARTVRIGCGCGGSSDLVEPAVKLLKEDLDYLMLETIGSVATTKAAKRADKGDIGYHPSLRQRLKSILAPAAKHNTTIVTNGGVTDPVSAGEVAKELIRDENLSIQVVVVTGDECTDLVRRTAATAGEDAEKIISAHAYIGMEEVMGGLQKMDSRYDAHVLIGGRIADPSLAVAPLAYEFGWESTDWEKLGQATVIGHLLECGPQVTGGYFADPPRKEVPELAFLGYPYAKVEQDGTAVITKAEGTGGRVDSHTVREQLFYEIHDPASYITPDVIADFTSVKITEISPDTVKVAGGSGKKRPETLKTLVVKDGSYKFEVMLPYGGPNAVGRAALAKKIINDRLVKIFGVDPSEYLRIEIVGLNVLYADACIDSCERFTKEPGQEEVLLRISGVSANKEILERAHSETKSLVMTGPAGCGIPIPYSSRGVDRNPTVEPRFIEREEITGNIGHIVMDT